MDTHQRPVPPTTPYSPPTLSSNLPRSILDSLMLSDIGIIFICMHMFAYSHFLSTSLAAMWLVLSGPLPTHNIPHYAAHGHPSVSVPNVSIRYVGSPCPPCTPLLRFVYVSVHSCGGIPPSSSRCSLRSVPAGAAQDA